MEQPNGIIEMKSAEYRMGFPFASEYLKAPRSPATGAMLRSEADLYVPRKVSGRILDPRVVE